MLLDKSIYLRTHLNFAYNNFTLIFSLIPCLSLQNRCQLKYFSRKKNYPNGVLGCILDQGGNLLRKKNKWKIIKSEQFHPLNFPFPFLILHQILNQDTTLVMLIPFKAFSLSSKWEVSDSLLPTENSPTISFHPFKLRIND